MQLQRTGILATAVVLLASSVVTGCRRAVVIVPERRAGFTARDTLYGTYRRQNVRITFRHDTTWRVDTIVRLDTLWRAGTRTILRVDTVRIGRVDTLRLARVDTLVRHDTLRIAGIFPRRDTVRVIVRDTIRLLVRDTVRLTVRDTLRLTTRDTIFRTDTVRLAGRRVLFVPPGQYPPAGQCRVWIPDRPPGQQAEPVPCHSLGRIPSGAFILFAGEAWDFDYDWLADPGAGAPPEIIALTRRRRP